MQKSEHVITLKHYLVLCVSAFAVGIFLAVRLGKGTGVSFALFLCALFTAVLSLRILPPLVRRQKIVVTKSFLLPCTLIFLTLAGLSFVYFTEFTAYAPLREFSGQSVWLTGRVATVPQKSASFDSYSFVLDVCSVEAKDKTVRTGGSVKISMSGYSAEKLTFGESLECWTALSEPTAAEFADEFDYASYLRSKNIFLIGKTKTFNPVSNDVAPHSLISRIKGAGIFLNKKLNAAADALYSHNTDDRAALKGVLTGDKTEFSELLRDSFSNAGISHIAAVSGMHMSMLFSAFTYLLAFARLNRKTALLLCIPVILMFASTAAFTPSVCRSALMLAVMILSVLLGERYSPVTSLFLALGIILIVSPYSLFSASLLMSFGATLGILVYFKYISHFLTKAIRLRFLADSLSLSLSSFIGTAYFTALFFGRVSLIQLLTNLWVIPLVSVVFCLGYLSCIFYYIFPSLSFHILRYPVAGALHLITLTAKHLGTDTLVIKTDALNAYTAAGVWVGFSILLYLLLKTLYDSSIQNSRQCF